MNYVCPDSAAHRVARRDSARRSFGLIADGGARRREAPLSPPANLPYLRVMTKLLEKAVEAVRKLPPGEQDGIAHAMLRFAQNDGEPENIDPAHLPAILRGLAQAKRGQLASDAEVEAALGRFDP